MSVTTCPLITNEVVILTLQDLDPSSCHEVLKKKKKKKSLECCSIVVFPVKPAARELTLAVCCQTVPELHNLREDRKKVSIGADTGI